MKFSTHLIIDNSQKFHFKQSFNFNIIYYESTMFILQPPKTIYLVFLDFVIIYPYQIVTFKLVFKSLKHIFTFFF